MGSSEDDLPWSLADGLRLVDPSPVAVLKAMGVEPTGWRVERRPPWSREWMLCARTHGEDVARRGALRVPEEYPGWEGRAVPYWTIVGGAE